MRKIISLLLISISSFAQQGAPATYYNGFNWSLTGNALKTALATKITTTHTNQLSYAEAENAIRYTDLDPSDGSNTNVFLIYGFSDNICPSGTSDENDHRRRNKNDDGTGNCQWNREHTYAKSLGNPDLGTSGPGADVHHLRAADVERNSDRGSEKFAAGSGNSGDIGANWYPGDEWKGDIARMMMYMYLRYGNQCLPINVGVGTPVATDTNMIQLFLDWNAQDPVSQVETNRNNYLGNTSNPYGQGNRNPFIDNPYLATKIWGGQPAENFWPTIFLSTNEFDWTTDITIYPNPTNDNRISIATQSNIDEIELISVNGQLMQKIENPVLIDNAYTLENLPKGFYLLKLSSENESIVKKVIVN